NCDDAQHRAYVRGMLAGEPGGQQQGLYKLARDPRITAIGAFLRKTSLDDLQGTSQPGTSETELATGTAIATEAALASETGQADLAAPAGAVADSMSVAIWTVISRVTGVLRGITIAAVLGATYFANTYQFTNSLPNLIFYGLLAGSLFSSLLVPALVQHIRAAARRAVARTAGGLLGVALVGMLAIVPVMALLTPWLLRLGSIGASDA